MSQSQTKSRSRGKTRSNEFLVTLRTGEYFGQDSAGRWVRKTTKVYLTPAYTFSSDRRNARRFGSFGHADGALRKCVASGLAKRHNLDTQRA